MTNTNATNLRKNLFSYLESAIDYNDVINVNTKKGNAIIISETEYNGLLETLYLLSDPNMKEKIEKLNTFIQEKQKIKFKKINNLSNEKI